MRSTIGRLFGIGLVFFVGCGDGDEGATTLNPDPTSVEAPADLSNRLFNDNELNDVRLTIAPADWDSIIQDTRGDEYRTAVLSWKEITIDQVAIRPSGSASRYPGNQKMSLRLDFNEFVPGRKFLGLGSLKLDGLREGTLIRERFTYDVYRSRLRIVPRAVHCRLFVNGEYRGVYEIEERVSDGMVKRRYNSAHEGNLYRIRVTRPEAFAYRGSNPALYTPEPWERHSNETSSDHADVPRFLDILNNRPADLSTVCDLENLTDYLACEAAVISYDGVLRNEGLPHNFYVYDRPETDKMELIPWDLDQTWDVNQTDRSIWFNFETTALARVVRATPALNELYRKKIREIIATATLPENLAKRIDFIYEQIKDAAHADPYKLRTNAEFDSYPAYFKEVARRRYVSLSAQLDSP